MGTKEKSSAQPTTWRIAPFLTRKSRKLFWSSSSSTLCRPPSRRFSNLSATRPTNTSKRKGPSRRSEEPRVSRVIGKESSEGQQPTRGVRRPKAETAGKSRSRSVAKERKGGKPKRRHGDVGHIYSGPEGEGHHLQRLQGRRPDLLRGPLHGEGRGARGRGQGEPDYPGRGRHVLVPPAQQPVPPRRHKVERERGVDGLLFAQADRRLHKVL